MTEYMPNAANTHRMQLIRAWAPSTPALGHYSSRRNFDWS